MEASERDAIIRLLRSQRWAALATLHDDRPYASMIAFVAEPDPTGVLLHLSRLAPHTRNLLRHPQAALIISEPDSGSGDPQTLARLTLEGEVQAIERNTETYERARDRYLARLPDAEALFEFSDFQLFRLAVRQARYVGGFARAHSLRAEQLRELTDREANSAVQ